MPRRWLVDLIEGYRWLWSAQRRWHPVSRWLAAIGFGVRVLADIMRLLLPPLRVVNRLRVKHLALASLVLVVALVVDAQRRGGGPGVEPTIVTWADSTGGFEVVFPAEWVATDADRDEPRPAVAGSTHRRPAGGTLLKRHLTARAYDLGEIPPGITTKNLAFLASGIRAPGETIVRPALAGEGTYVTAYRSPGGADDASNAAVFFRGRDGHGFMLEITGHREDETLLVDEAFAIARSLRHEQTVLNDLAILLAQSFFVPSGAMERARAMEVDAGMPRRVVPATRPRELEPFVVNANLFLDTGTASASVDECRARAVLLWSRQLTRFTGGARPVEFRVACQTSNVVIGLRTPGLGPILDLRQFDNDGRVIFEQSVLPPFVP
jgi:hypothetical protein